MVSWKKIKNGAFAELYSHKKLRLVTIIILSFAGILYGLGNGAGGMADVGVLLYFAALLCLYIAVINVFSDMHDIPSADVQMSMPLNSSERYLSRLLCIFLIWLLPAIISGTVACLLNLMLDSLRKDIEYYYILEVAFGYAQLVLKIMAITIICQCCVGSKAESRYMPVLVFGVYELLPFEIKDLIQYKFADSSIHSYVSGNYGSEYTAGDYLSLLLAFLLVCIIYIAIIFAGILIYKKRDARSVGKPIVFPLFFEIVIMASLMLFFTFSHFGYSVSLSLLFVAWLGSIILRIIASRKGFKFGSVVKWTVQYAAYYAVFILFMFAAFKTGGFGALYKQPERSDFYEYTRLDIDVSSIEDGRASYDCCFLMETERLNNAMQLYDLTETVSEYAKEQPKTKGLFMKKMFNLGGSDIKECDIYIRSSKDDEDYGYEFTYSTNFCLSKERAEEFIGRLSDYDFVIDKDYNLE